MLKFRVRIPSVDADATLLVSLEALPEVYVYLYFDSPGPASPSEGMVPEQEPSSQA